MHRVEGLWGQLQFSVQTTLFMDLQPHIRSTYKAFLENIVIIIIDTCWLDFMMATVLECQNTERLENLKMAQSYYTLFVSINTILIWCQNHPRIFRTVEIFPGRQGTSGDDVKEARFENGLNKCRDLKIIRMKRILKLKSFEIPEGRRKEEYDEINLVWMDIVHYYVLLTIDRLGMFLGTLVGAGENCWASQDWSKERFIGQGSRSLSLVKDRKVSLREHSSMDTNLPNHDDWWIFGLGTKKGEIS